MGSRGVAKRSVMVVVDVRGAGYCFLEVIVLERAFLFFVLLLCGQKYFY